MKCKYCESDCIRKGCQSNGVKKYQCRECKKYQQENYCYHAYDPEIKTRMRMLKRGGCYGHLFI